MADDETPTEETPTPSEDNSEKVREVGTYAAGESEDNSVATSDDAYVGVSPEYRNYANSTDEPLVSENDDEADLVAAQNEREAALSTTNKVNATHPTEVVHPTNPTLEQKAPPSRTRK